MTLVACVVVALMLAGIQAGYFRLARYFDLVERPNARSSHTNLTTIRGGGVLFVVAELGAFFYNGLAQPYFFAGLLLVATVSFLDDLRPLPSGYRLGAQGVGVGLLLYEIGLISNEAAVVLGLFILGTGILNVWNFMDGINGMTAWYGIVCVGTLWCWRWQAGLFVADSFLPFAFIALLIFSYANARRQAVCFAGDVGSISIAFIVLLPLVQLMIHLQTGLPLLLLAVYGVDSVLTILHRIWLRQNIFRAHRLHLFQRLVHQRNWSHLRVSGMYAFLQLVINMLIVSAVHWECRPQWLLASGILVILTSLHVAAKRWLTQPY